MESNLKCFLAAFGLWNGFSHIIQLVQPGSQCSLESKDGKSYFFQIEYKPKNKTKTFLKLYIIFSSSFHKYMYVK